MSSNGNTETDKKDDTFEVHSANNWETADLGDKSRNEKFLRLMGAAKKEHHGRFVIGDQDGKHREKSDEKHMADELEEQYKHSLEHSLAGGKKGHIGLGFHEEDDKPKDEDEVVGDKEGSGDAETKEEVDSDIKETVESEEKESGHRKRESVDESTHDDHDEVKKMKFVKSSS